MRAVAVFPLILTVLLVSACSTSKVSTTPRSAVEMAILSESAEKALYQLRGGLPTGKRFYLNTSEFEASDEEFVLSTLRLELLRQGMFAVEDSEDADVVIIPRTAISAIDEGSTLIGIPEFPIPVPTVGVINTPEIALFKRMKQEAVTRIGYYGINREDASLAFDKGTGAASSTYTRWRVLFVISFRTTDLSEPYRRVPGPLSENP